MAEQQLDYRPSSYTGNGANCVEAAAHSAGVSVRDSKNTNGPTIECTHAGWATFIRETVHGLPHANGEIVVTDEEAKLTYDTVGTKMTCWHLHAVHPVHPEVVPDGIAGERDAFISGARDGEFNFTEPSLITADAS